MATVASNSLAVMATVQCYLPRPAADAVQIDQIRARARAADVPNASLEYSYYRAQGRCRVTCQQPVAEFLAGELRLAIAKSKTVGERTACEEGLAALLGAMATADTPGLGFGPIRMGDSPERGDGNA